MDFITYVQEIYWPLNSFVSLVVSGKESKYHPLGEILWISSQLPDDTPLLPILKEPVGQEGLARASVSLCVRFFSPSSFLGPVPLKWVEALCRQAADSTVSWGIMCGALWATTTFQLLQYLQTVVRLHSAEGNNVTGRQKVIPVW